MSQEEVQPEKGSNIINGFLQSFSFFSVLPIGAKRYTPNKEFYNVMLFTMPFVGFVLGLISVLFFTIISSYVAVSYAAFISAALYVSLYGFLHLEAVSDVIDAWFASLSGKDVSAVMKEPQVGAVGAVGTTVIVALKLAAITYLLINESAAMFLAAIVLSRFAGIVGLGVFDFKKGGEYTIRLSLSAGFGLIFFATVFYMSLLAFPLDVNNVVLLSIFAIAIMLFLLYKLDSKFGFVNGDCIGFSIVITEIVLLNLGLLV
ncbi:MAG: adenosylcobinamide-GDP ribazoletransferase [Campylobacteraceae bacterium]|nr:adenosylcobinamide-GDP ribazoletransferase [Campylobacteraceae bacterium]